MAERLAKWPGYRVNPCGASGVIWVNDKAVENTQESEEANNED